ncbi:hypothetical protein ACQPZF_12800 [Actinosynnema sp. CS-041913]|uniref:hypothetical protein n=1 Tax=Actinosynnema sp. CS-041913 TaxID=3239917 RepID=UPI003D8EC2C6
MRLARPRRNVPRTLAAALSGGAIALTACGATQTHTSGKPIPASTAATTGVPTSGGPARTGTAEPPTTSTPRTTAVPPTAPVPGVGGWCSTGDLEITAAEHVSPSADSRLFAVHFAGRAATRCTIGGTLSDVTFAAQDGSRLDVEIGGGQPQDYTEISVGDGREAVVYLRTAPDSGAGLPAATVSFSLPGKGTKGPFVTVAWPAPFDGPLSVTNLMEPVG